MIIPNESDNPEEEFRKYAERSKVTFEEACDNALMREVGMAYGFEFEEDNDHDS